MQELLDKVDVEMIVEDKLYEILKKELTIEVSRDYSYDLPPDKMKLEVEFWFGGEKIDSDYVEV